MISFACPKCGHLVHAAAKVAGKTVPCPKCGYSIQVPASLAEQASDDKPVTRPCPNCDSPLRLTRALDGQRVRCNACGASLLVSADPWTLSPVTPIEKKRESAQRDEDPGAPAGVAAREPGPEVSRPRAPIAKRGPTTPPPVLRSAAGPPPLPEAAVRKAGGWSSPHVNRILVALVGASLVVALLVLGGSVVFLGRGTFRALRYMPDECYSLQFGNIEELAGTDAIEELAHEWSLDFKPAGLDFTDFTRMTTMHGASGGIRVIELNRSFHPTDEFLATLQQRGRQHPATIAGHKVYLSPHAGICFPDRRTIVAGGPGALREVLERDRQPQISESMKLLLRSVDGSQLSGSATDRVWDHRHPPTPLKGFPDDIWRSLRDEAEGFSEQLVLRGRRVHFALNVLLPDRETAENVRRDACDGLTDVPEIRISAAGRIVKLRTSAREDELANWMGLGRGS